MLALTVFAHGLVLSLAALIIGPLPAADGPFPGRKQAASAQSGGLLRRSSRPKSSNPLRISAWPPRPSDLVPLEGDDAAARRRRRTVLEKTYPQGSGEKYVACGAGSIKNNTRVPAAEIAAEVEAPLPFAVEWNSPEPQILIMHTHATEDYRLSAGLWFRPGDGSRTTDRNYNMCAVGRVMADTLNTAGLNTLHDETLNDYPQLHRQLRQQPRCGAAVLSPIPQHQGGARCPPRRHRDRERLPDGPGVHRERPAGGSGDDHLRV